MATEVIVEKMKKYPALYNVKHPDHKNYFKREKLWDQFATEMKMNTADLKKKWKNTKDSYLKYLRLVAECPPNETCRKWKWAPKMDFYKPYISKEPYPEINSNLEYDNSTANVLESYIIDADVPESRNMIVKISKRQKPINEKADDNKDFAIKKLKTANISKQLENDSASAEEEYKNVVDCAAPADNLGNYQSNSNALTYNGNFYQSQPSTAEMDGVDLLFLGYAKMLKTFTPRSQAITKLKIAEIFMEQELEQAEQHPIILSTSSC